MKTAFVLAFILLLLSFHSNAQQTIDKLNVNQLKLPKESANKALILDGAGQVKSSSTITDTELGYLEGLSDTLVNLLSGKANDSDVVKLTGNQSVDGVKTFTGKLVASSTVNGSIPCPVMTEAQRDLFTPVEGDCVYNSDTLKLNVFDGSVWKDVGGAGGISLWLTANPYNVNDIVIESDKIYRCLIAHTSGTFATDLGAGKWGEVSQGLTSPVALADGGTGIAITPVAGSIVYVDADSFEQLAPGTSGQVLQSNGSSAPSWVNKSISAKAENGSSVTAEELQVSNNQLTQVDTNKHLIESGNNNLLINPSFEHSTFSTGWTNSAGTFTEETVVEIHGKKAAKLVLSSQTMALTQDSSLYAAQFADGVQGLASVRVKSDVALKVCSRSAGVTSSSLCVDVQANNKWGLYKVPFILGATSNGISIASTGAVTGTVYIDDAFVGSVDLKADVDASKIAGESYFAGTTSCQWSRTSTTVGAFGSVAACPGPTIVNSSMGEWQTTDSDLPRQTINNLPAGTYKVKFIAPTFVGVSAVAVLAISDGTNTCEPQSANDSASSTVGVNVECVFKYNSAGNRTFELYGASNTGSINVIPNQPTPRRSMKFILEYFGSSSVYSSTNADTDWASCGHTAASFTGFGTVSAIETQCKRQGSDLLMRGKFTTGAVTATEARVSLPVWNGVQLTSAGTSKIQSLQIIGSSARSNVGAANTIFAAIQPSVSYSVFTAIGSPAGTTTLLGTSFGSSETQTMETLHIPIEGWQNSNIIIGQFNGLESCTNTLECTDAFSAKISAAGVVSDENVNWISGNATVTSTSNYAISFNPSIFTVAPNCVATIDTNTGNSSVANTYSITSSGLSVVTVNVSDVLVAKPFNIVCQKQGVDYIGKTARAVANDQNTSSVGVTKGTLLSFAFAGATEISGCASSPCVLYDSVGTPSGFSVSRPTTGTYDITFPSNFWVGTRYNCTISTITFAGGEQGNFYRTIAKTNTVQRFQYRSAAGASVDAAGSVVCFGERQ